jgi:thiamine-phosphate pyrophosphorylase
MTSSSRARLRGLYAITPVLHDTGLLAARAAAALEGGAALLQYRFKDIPAALALTQARRLAQLCERAGVPLIVNDSVEIAAAVGCGLHLGRDDEDAGSARKVLPRALIGVSCYNQPALAHEAAAQGADYVAIGSLFASGTKPQAARAALGDIGAARSAGLPVVAIGGITLDNAPQAIAAGADMVAVISAVFDAPDIASAARDFARLFAHNPSGEEKHVRPQPRTL